MFINVNEINKYKEKNNKYNIKNLKIIIYKNNKIKCATEEMADVRELCPEFYCMAEFLINQENLN